MTVDATLAPFSVGYSNFEWCETMDTIRHISDIHFYENGKYGDWTKFFHSVALFIYGLLQDAYSASGSIALNAETNSE